MVGSGVHLAPAVNECAAVHGCAAVHMCAAIHSLRPKTVLFFKDFGFSRDLVPNRLYKFNYIKLDDFLNHEVLTET